MAPDDHAVLKLAQRRAVEEEAFEAFLAKLGDLLRKRWLPTPAGIASLATYLEWRRQSSDRAEGDEQSVVAPLVRQLLETLGYEEGEGFTYNRALQGLKARAVPDYTVYAREFLASTPAFLVECKATSVIRLQGPQSSPLAQLRRYVLSGVVHGRAGLLCNGLSLEAWDFGSDGGTRLVHLDLETLAGTAADAESEWPGDQAGALRTLWNRFCRQAFVQAQDLYLLSSQAPPLPEEWIEKVRRRFEESGRPEISRPISSTTTRASGCKTRWT